MYMQLGQYLEHLKAIERTKPERARREVPSMRELADAAGINPVSLSRLETGKIGSLRFEIGAAILDELRRRGFETQPGDIIGYRPPEAA